jgi:hypothetical protein
MNMGQADMMTLMENQLPSNSPRAQGTAVAQQAFNHGRAVPPLTPLQQIVNGLPLRHPARLELHRLEQAAAVGPKALRSTKYVLAIIIVGNVVWHFFR